MEGTPPSFELEPGTAGSLSLQLAGDWLIQHPVPAFAELASQLETRAPQRLVCEASALGQWDSSLPAFLMLCNAWCDKAGIEFNGDALPEGARKLLTVASAVKPLPQKPTPAPTLAEWLDPRPGLRKFNASLADSLEFVGSITVALGKLVTGRANTRRQDFVNFVYQAGPAAFGIITLTSFLVGMILAYLGAAQLQQFGAQVYVANLVTIGMLREMGALMTAVVMAGRTGAAYAAQLGTMQTNEEIDAIVTLGISPVEFLVLPRMLALIVIMPLLCLYADVIGIFGGAIVAVGMDVSLTQFAVQLKSALHFNHLAVGLFKSLVFAILIAIAGCRAGMQCGRSSAAVGQAATNAVVTAIVYLIIADAGFNIFFQQLGI